MFIYEVCEYDSESSKPRAVNNFSDFYEARDYAEQIDLYKRFARMAKRRGGLENMKDVKLSISIVEYYGDYKTEELTWNDVVYYNSCDYDDYTFWLEQQENQ